ncbi:MAG: MFS transporter [Defluviitaleaceae bacterium]|nr:MFS transporter [Defluviitaleaceae bacterium]
MLMHALKNGKFRNFFLADIFSCFGIGLLTTGTSWYMLVATNSVRYVGFMASFNVVAGFLSSLVTGSIIDKFDRRKVIYTSSMIRVLVILIIMIAFLLNGFSVVLMYLLAIINGVGWNIYVSSSRSFAQEILPKEHLMSGNALSEMSLQAGMLASGLGAGFILNAFRFETLLGIYMFVFTISSMFIFAIKHKSEIKNNPVEEKFGSMFKEGVEYLRKKKSIFLFGLVSVIPVVVTSFYNVVLPSYVVDVVEANSFIFGLSDMFYGVGGLTSGFLMGLMVKRISNEKLVLLLFLFSSVNLFILFINTYFLVLFFGSFIFGLIHSGTRIVMNTKLMEYVEPKYMGRATSVWMGISFLINALGASLLGLVMDATHAGFGFLIMSCLMIFGFVVILSLLPMFTAQSKVDQPEKA